MRAIFLLSISLIIFSCSQPEAKQGIIKDFQQEKEELLKADKDFATMSQKKGYKAASFEYIDSNGVLLRPQSAPIEGADAVDNISMIVDSGFVMTWEPVRAVVANSGELGYTYGIYEIKHKQIKEGEATSSGTYVTIWKKQNDGKWKFVLNSANDGLGE